MSFKAGVTIRLIEDGKPFLVIQAFMSGVLVTDLENKDELITPVIILERNFDQWEEDWNLECKIDKNGFTSFKQYKT